MSLLAAVVCGACAYEEPEYWEDATCTGPGEVHVLARDEMVVTALVLDGEHLYWSSGARGPRRVHRNGGVVVDLMTALPPVANGRGGAGLAVDEAYVWFGVQGALWRVPRSGGPAVIVAGGNDNDGSGGQMLVDERYVWWVDYYYDALFRFEKRAPADGLYIDAFATGILEPTALALDDERVWFGAGVIDKDGYGLRGVPAGTNPVGIEVIGEHVFWAQEVGYIVRARIDTLAAEPGFPVSGRVGDLVSHEGRLFFALSDADGGWGEMEPDGTGLLTHRVDEAGSARLIAVSDDAVYLAAGNITTDIVKVCR